MMEPCDLFIIGGGPAGYVGALRAARAGLSVVLAEGEKLGGACLHWGCIPSKSLMASAELLEKIHQAQSFGIAGIDGRAARPDWPAMNGRGGKIVQRLEKGIDGLLAKAGVRQIHGMARVLARDRVAVGEEEFACRHLLLATGADYPRPAFALDDPRLITPRDVYSMPDLPDELAIVGAGVVGSEFAVLFSRLGVKVTLIDTRDESMPYLDRDLQNQWVAMLKRRRVQRRMGARVVGLNAEGLQLQTKDGTEVLAVQRVLWCPRRQARLEGLDPLLAQGLAVAGGYLKTDERARTSLPGVYAAGDVNGRLMLAHVASKEALTAVETILGCGRDLVYGLMPYNMYTAPEMASVGLTEQQAEAQGYLVASGKFPLAANGKALADGDSDGFVKIVFERRYNEILGVHIAGPQATDFIGEAVLALSLEANLESLESLVHPHPTLSEIMVEAAWKGLDRPIHSL